MSFTISISIPFNFQIIGILNQLKLATDRVTSHLSNRYSLSKTSSYVAQSYLVKKV